MATSAVVLDNFPSLDILLHLFCPASCPDCPDPPLHCHQVESIKASTLQRQQQLDSEAAELQQQQAELTQRLLDFQGRVSRTEAALQEREAQLGDLQVGAHMHVYTQQQQQQQALLQQQ